MVKGPFHFFNMWFDHLAYNSSIVASWRLRARVHGLLNISRNLSILRVKLRCFNKITFGNAASLEVNNIQAALILNPNDHSLPLKERAVLDSYDKASRAYEKFVYQKNTITWLKLGHDSTGFFHASSKSQARNRIPTYLDNGVCVDSFEKVKAHFINHFKSSMGTLVWIVNILLLVRF